MGNIDHHMVDQTWAPTFAGKATSTALWGLRQDIDHITIFAILGKICESEIYFSILRTQLGKDLTLETNLKIRSECTWDYRQSKVPERCPTRAQHRYLEACVVAAASKISMCFMGGSLQTGPCRKH